MKKRWFVVYTKSGYEDSVRRDLENKGFETFFPIYEVLSPHKNRAFRRVCPFFPSYLFVKFDPEVTQWRSINGMYGVLALIGCTEEYVTPLPIGVVEELMLKRDERGFLKIAELQETQPLQEGEKIEIQTGPWFGQVGTVWKTKEERVVILLSLLSGCAKLILPTSSVRRV